MTRSPLQQMHDVMEELNELCIKLEVAINDPRPVEISKLVQQHQEQREKLVEIQPFLQGFIPVSKDDQQLIKRLKVLAQKVEKGDQLFRLWKQDMIYYTQYGYLNMANAIRNLPYFVHDPSTHYLKDRFKGIPAVVVSAGPSLDKNFHLIEKVKGKALIISMNRCVELFALKGIQPDLTLVTDVEPCIPHKHCVKANSETIPNWVIRISCHPDMYQLDTVKRFKYSCGLDHENELMKLAGDEASVLPGGSVAHSCIRMAVDLGCHPIAIIGQDMALRDGQRYSDNDIESDIVYTAQEEDKQAFSSGKRANKVQGPRTNENPQYMLVEVPGYYGGTVTTSSDLIPLIDYMTALIESLPEESCVINCTEGGAHLKGMEQMPFADFIDEYCHDEYDMAQLIDEGYQAGQDVIGKVSYKTVLHRIEKELVELLEITHKATKAVEGMHDSEKKAQQAKRMHRKLTKYCDKLSYLLQSAHITQLAQKVMGIRRVSEGEQELIDYYNSIEFVAVNLLRIVRETLRERAKSL